VVRPPEQAATTTGDQLVAALRRSRLLLLACAIAGVLAAMGLSRQAAPRYQSTAAVLLSQVDLGAVVPGASTPSSDPQRKVDTAVQLGESGAFFARVERLVGARLRRPESSLPGSFGVQSSADTDQLAFTARAGSARTAELIANTAATAYPDYRGEQLSAPLARAAAALRREGPSASAAAALRRIEVLEELTRSSASVTERATSADKLSATPVRNGVLGLVSGLVLGLLLMALREGLSGRLDAPEDIERALDARVLGSFPRRSGVLGRGGANGAGTAVERLVVLLGARRSDEGEAVVCFLGANPGIETAGIVAATVRELERRGETTRQVDVRVAPSTVREPDGVGWVVVEGPSYLESPTTLELATVMDVAILVTRASMPQRELRRISRELEMWPRRPYVAVLTLA
jgi:capsular polysaccharide biosynthesis protein